MKDEKTIVIDINLTRGLMALLALALLMAALVGYLTWGQREAAASGPQAPLAASSGMRQYYLTTTPYNGAEADGTDGNGAGVCASGYHFASLWEILDPSSLKYNTDLGYTKDDSGQGPPTYLRSWIRTGFGSSTAGTAGLGNCNAWTSSDSDHRGTDAYLTQIWEGAEDIHVWNAGLSSCLNELPVWCVED
jgi:hypothetical protein